MIKQAPGFAVITEKGIRQDPLCAQYVRYDEMETGKGEEERGTGKEGRGTGNGKRNGENGKPTRTKRNGQRWSWQLPARPAQSQTWNQRELGQLQKFCQ